MNKYKWNFTYIIPFNSTLDNMNNLRKIIQWVNGWSGVELIVVEYDSKSPKLDIMSESFTHVYVKADSSNFNRSWAYNVGVKNSTSEVIICGDSNTVTNPDNIRKGLELLKEYDVVKPFSKVVEVAISQLSDFNKMDNTIHAPVVGDNDDRVNYLCNNITIYKRDTLLKIGGWEEKFKMDCFEEFQSYKVKKLTKWIEMDGKGYSLPSGKAHHDGIVSEDINTNNHLKILTTEKLQRYITTTYNNVGMKSKYE